MRPKIICHMITSIDGKLHPERWTRTANVNDKKTLSAYYEDKADELHANGWIVGRTTMSYYAKGHDRTSLITPLPSEQLRKTYIAERSNRQFAITIDPKGKLHYGRENQRNEHRLTILSESVSDEYLTELQEDNVSYLFAGTDGTDLNLAMNILYNDFGVTKLLLEGGGIINGTFLQAKLVDEISLLIYPGLDGCAGVQSIFEYQGEQSNFPTREMHLRLYVAHTLDAGMVWLRYFVDYQN